MEDNAVALAAIGVLGTAVVGMVWVIKFALSKLSKDLQEHTKAAMSQSETNKKVSASIDTYSHQNEELLAFMKNLNGRLQNAVIQKVEEQYVARQTISKS